jgi:Arc/MetJ-type ribon-helix-helix transcriptional regulator
MAKQLSVRVDDELERMIDEEKQAHPYDPTESDIVRTALREYLEGNANNARAVTAD